MENNHTVEIKDFVIVVDDLFSKQYCDNVISFFEDAKQKGFGSTKKKKENEKQINKEDYFVFTNHTLLRESNYASEFNSKFWSVAYANYVNKYGALENADRHSIYEIKLQKTEIGQGYHVWHFENDSKASISTLFRFKVNRRFIQNKMRFSYPA